MELKEFIKHTIVDISKAVDEANADLKEIGGFVSTNNISFSKDGNSPSPKAAIDNNGDTHIITEIEFDIAVTTAKTKGQEGGGKIEVLPMKLGFGGKIFNHHNSVSTNRIKFTIPLALPHKGIKERNL